MPNKVYVAAETARTWSDSGTTSDELLDIGGLAADDVSGMGSYWDLGSASRSEWYEWEFHIAGFDTPPVVGEAVHLYFAMSNATTTGWDGEPDTAPGDATEGTLDGTAADRRASLPNLLYAGSVVVRTTTAADELRKRGVVRLPSRYVSPVVHNDTADALLSTSDDHMITLTPIPAELQ